MDESIRDLACMADAAPFGPPSFESWISESVATFWAGMFAALGIVVGGIWGECPLAERATRETGTLVSL
jgi:hypothetical protein